MGTTKRSPQNGQVIRCLHCVIIYRCLNIYNLNFYEHKHTHLHTQAHPTHTSVKLTSHTTHTSI